MGFERFIRTRHRGSKAFASHYAHTGYITISSFAMRQYNLSEYHGVVLYYDKETNEIGIEFTNNEEVEGFKPLLFNKNRNVVFTGKSFMKYFGISSFKQKPFRKVKDLFFTIDLNR